MDMMINNVRVLTNIPDCPLIEEGFVGIRDGQFSLVSLVQPRIMAHIFVEGTGKTLVPAALLAPLQVLLQGETDVIWLEATADAVLLEGAVEYDGLEEIRLSQISMILRQGTVLWQKVM